MGCMGEGREYGGHNKHIRQLGPARHKVAMRVAWHVAPVRVARPRKPLKLCLLRAPTLVDCRGRARGTAVICNGDEHGRKIVFYDSFFRFQSPSPSANSNTRVSRRRPPPELAATGLLCALQGWLPTLAAPPLLAAEMLLLVHLTDLQAAPIHTPKDPHRPTPKPHTLPHSTPHTAVPDVRLGSARPPRRSATHTPPPSPFPTLTRPHPSRHAHWFTPPGLFARPPPPRPPPAARRARASAASGRQPVYAPAWGWGSVTRTRTRARARVHAPAGTGAPAPPSKAHTHPTQAGAWRPWSARRVAQRGGSGGRHGAAA